MGNYKNPNYIMNDINYYLYQSKNGNDTVNSNTNGTSKYEKFKSELQLLETISARAEAKEFMQKLLPALKNCHSVKVDDAVCTVYESFDKYRVVLDSEQEMFYYDFK